MHHEAVWVCGIHHEAVWVGDICVITLKRRGVAHAVYMQHRNAPCA